MSENSPHLRSVPDTSVVERRAPAASWVMGLSEPLLSTRRRTHLDAEMSRFITTNPQWAAYWFAGVCHDLLASLPAPDPWRHLAGALDLGRVVAECGLTRWEVRSGETEIICTPGPAPAEKRAGSGAWLPDGRDFGTENDSMDLIPSGFGDSTTDVALVGLTEPLTTPAAALAALAGDVEVGALAWSKLFHTLSSAQHSVGFVSRVGAGEVFLELASSVMRRLIHRRRIYTGPEDPFPSVLAFAWLARADRLVLTPSRAISAEIELNADARIDDDMYDDLRIH